MSLTGFVLAIRSSCEADLPPAEGSINISNCSQPTCKIYGNAVVIRSKYYIPSCEFSWRLWSACHCTWSEPRSLLLKCAECRCQLELSRILRFPLQLQYGWLSAANQLFDRPFIARAPTMCSACPIKCVQSSSSVFENGQRARVIKQVQILREFKTEVTRNVFILF